MKEEAPNHVNRKPSESDGGPVRATGAVSGAFVTETFEYRVARLCRFKEKTLRVSRQRCTLVDGVQCPLDGVPSAVPDSERNTSGVASVIKILIIAL